MYLSSLVCWLSACGLCSAFFIWKEKKPLFLCYKICPLYCPKIKKHDDDVSSLTYLDKDDFFNNFTLLLEHKDKQPNCDSGRCMWTATTTAPDKAKSRQKRYDYDPSYIYDELGGPVYSHHHKPYPPHPQYYVLKPKTTTTTAAPTTADFTYEEVEFQHPSFIDYDSTHHGHHYPRYFLRKPKSKPPTTTKAPTTTEEPTFICEVCKSKCGS